MTTAAAGDVRIGVDIGGTFTDVVVLDAEGGIRTRKVSSTVGDYARGITDALLELMGDEGLSALAIREIIHGTTVATNAILQHAGARTGLLTTEGFRDVLEIRRLRMPELYNLLYEKPPPLVARALRREVPERLSARGEVLTPLDEAAARDQIRYLREQGVESVAVCLLNAYANPVHERRLGALLEEMAPDLSYSLSCDVLPEVREYERTSTTVINAYIRPVVERYLRSLRAHLTAIGIACPVLIMQSSGGILSLATAMVKPVHIVESGPAAGVVGARHLVARMGLGDAISFDMGGTTAKASLIEAGQARVTSEFEVGAGLSGQGLNLAGGGYAMKVPVLDIAEVGAGGGSIIWIDAGGSLQIGPRSAGAEPGPVCYGRGGTAATVTDANVVLGYVNPAYLAGGSVPIDAARARQAIAEQVAGPLDLPLLEAAWAAHVVANAHMIGALKAVSTQRGRDPRAFTLVAFGGNGPVHAAGMAQLLEMRQIIVPPTPGLFSAVGLLHADHEHHAVQTYYRPFAEVAVADLQARLDALAREALAELTAEGHAPDQVRLHWTVDLRYIGQGFELTVPLPDGPIGSATLAGLAEIFHTEHARTYGHRATDPIQFVNLRLTARGPRPPAAPARAESNGHAPAPPLPARLAYFGAAGQQLTPVVRRADLSAAPRSGPFIVEEYDATTVVPPGWTGRIDVHGNIIIEVEA